MSGEMSSGAEIRPHAKGHRRRALTTLLVGALVGLLAANALSPASAAAGDISTVAGSGIAGCSGDGGPATSAQLTNPQGMAVDSAGNVYIADWGCNVVRRIDATTGVITTVAGNGGPGYTGDGGLATSAQVGGPGDVALDSAGNLYISMIGEGQPGHVVRRVDAVTGIITTVAGTGTPGDGGDGGPAASALLLGPFGIDVDSAGNLYIADAGSNRIRRVDAASGIITTVAGNGIRGFTGDGVPATNTALNSPFDVLVNPNGNLYIADGDNCRVRRVDAVTGIITTVVGGNGCSNAGQEGVATAVAIGRPWLMDMDAAGNLFWGEADSHRVRKLDLATGMTTIVAGTGVRGSSGDGGPATSAQLNEPIGVALNQAGDLFVAESAFSPPGGHRVRKVEAAGAPVTTSTTSTSTTLAPTTTSTSTTLAPTTTTTQAPPTGVPTTKDQCKDGGWQSFGFRNQGQCVSFVASRGKSGRGA